MNGNLLIVSAPSGTGKTSILKRVIDQVKQLEFSVSHTTRPSRNGEQEGRDYHFVMRQTFERMIAENAFLEWAMVHDNYYGTAVEPVEEKLRHGFDVILDIDVQGAEIIRQQHRIDYIDVFIAPPDATELEARLRRRGTEDEQSIATRLANSAEEMEQSSKYRYLVVNDQLEDAVTMLCAIIYAQRAEGRRNLHGVSHRISL
ncbi:MAG: guanylate kinase [Desulfofustis sp.]|nr:guanylate kinase [Desulfofustis sp.]